MQDGSVVQAVYVSASPQESEDINTQRPWSSRKPGPLILLLLSEMLLWVNLWEPHAITGSEIQSSAECSRASHLSFALSLCTCHPSQPLPVFLSLSYFHAILHDLLSWHIEICILWCFQVSRCLASYILIYRCLMGTRPCTHSPPSHARTIWCFL